MNTPYYGSYYSAYPDNPYGRSPLSAGQIGRINQLAAARPKSNVPQHDAMTLIDFTRPQCSLILERFEDKDSPEYKEALSIIQLGKDQLAKQPREDMLGSGAIPVSTEDVARSQLFMTQAQCEAQARQAAIDGKAFYPYKPAETPSKAAQQSNR